ncbi:hypothetical protein G9A89_007669 [Geosiphon pyriformis]|nr:hypothetical protein G9A89_007669 [Geosiphon pyriformis]
MKTQETPPTTIVTVVTKKNTVTQKDTENETRNRALLVENHYQEGATGMTYQTEKERHYPHDKDELYNTAQAKVRGGTTEEIRRWKESAEVANEVTSYNMFDPVDEFQDYYQQLCPTRQEQEQYFAQINTYLCENCLILDLEKKMEIENQHPESEKFVAYTNLEQVTDIQYFDNGHLRIIPERAYPTNARFDLHYPKDQSTTLPPRSITKIDLKIVVKILSGIMNNSEKPYTIESKKKIAQAIFLPLVKIGKFVPVKNREKLSQTMRGTFGFRSTEK